MGFLGSWVGKISWRRKWQSTPAVLPGKSHGRRSLRGYSPWDSKESDTTEGLHFHFQTYIARQDSLSMEFPKQEYWSGLLFPPPGDLPKWGTELSPLALADRFFTTEPPGKPQYWGLNIFLLLIYSCQFKMCLSALLYGSSRWVWIYGSPACLETLG